MGTNGDQIDRIFMASKVFFVQFVGQIEEDIFHSLENNSKSSTMGQTIYYGVMGGNNTTRIFTTFPN